MNIVLNFVPLKSGGGLQVGLDFLRQLADTDTGHRWYLVASEGTPFAAGDCGPGVERVAIVRRGLRDRLLFEHHRAAALVRRVGAKLVYTQFGPHWPAARVLHVVGCAYSNLFYPEVNFWTGLPPLQRLRKQVIDQGRLRRLRRADHVIFETSALAQRAITVRGFSPERVSVVRPAASSLVVSNRRGIVLPMTRSLPTGMRVLLPSGYHPNKNVELLPRVAALLRKRYARHDFMFVITLPGDHPGTRRLLAQARELDVAEHLHNVGPVAPEALAELYRNVDAVILPSRLESFSNSIAEAWAMDKPLIISNLDWARALCGNAAEYFEYDDTDSAAAALVTLADDRGRRRALVDAGRAQLATYPTARERFFAYLDIIERAAAGARG